MQRGTTVASWLAAAALLSNCQSGNNTNSAHADRDTDLARPPAISSRRLPEGHPPSRAGGMRETQMGLASFTSEALQGRPTKSGQDFDNRLLVAAHPSYPMGTVVQVINLGNERAVEVRIIDRSAPADRRGRGYIIDLSRSAAEELDFVEDGRARVRTEVIEWGGGH